MSEGDDMGEGQRNPGENVVRGMFRNAEKLDPVSPAPDAAGQGSSSSAVRDDPQKTPPAPPEDGHEPPTDDGGGPSGGEGGPPAVDLGEDCPVTPLGANGDSYFFLDHRGAFRVFSYEKLLAKAPNTLLGPDSAMGGWAWRKFPTYNRDGDQTGWSEKNCGRAFMIACSLLDVWKGLDRVRGAGAWRGEEGELILNLGNELMIVPKDGARSRIVTRKPGVIGRHVYPADDPQPRPWHEPVEGGARGPGDLLLETFSSWSWARPDVDPLLMLGWVAAAMLGGALDWRASALVTGDKGAGKSTLENAVEHILGSLIHTADATGAALWTALGYSSLPIAIDEFEASANDTRAKNIINLMRVSASGGVILRGSADHKLATFQARSPFLFSGISLPEFEAQDMSRLAVLELKPLPEDAPPPDTAPARMRELGAKLRRRMIDNWYRWDSVFAQCRELLKERGHDARGADQFGTLMAAAELAMHDAAEKEPRRLAARADQLAAATLAETADAETPQEQCLKYILSSIPDAWSGGLQRSVARHIRTILSAGSDADSQKALASFGLRLYRGKDEILYLAVANRSHRGAQQLFHGSKWGATDWGRLLRRLPGARAVAKDEGGNVSIGGACHRATLVPVAICIDDEAAREEAEWRS